MFVYTRRKQVALCVCPSSISVIRGLMAVSRGSGLLSSANIGRAIRHLPACRPRVRAVRIGCKAACAIRRVVVLAVLSIGGEVVQKCPQVATRRKALLALSSFRLVEEHEQKDAVFSSIPAEVSCRSGVVPCA